MGRYILKIVVITGTRADWGIYIPIIREMINKGLDVNIIPCGTHLAPTFGYTIDEIKKDNFKIAGEIEITLNSDTGVGMATSFGVAVIKFSQIFNLLQPDILLVLGDRGEMLAAAISASYSNITVAHLHGGEQSGSIDDRIRDAITRFSSIHLCATEKSKKRIIELIGKDKNIFVVGAPSLDTILNEKLYSKKVLLKEFEIDGRKPILLVSQHSVTTEVEDAGMQMEETMSAVKELGMQTLLFLPNSDAGGFKMREVIKKYSNLSYIRLIENIGHKKYLSLLKIVDVLIGNSSSGIIEAPSFHLPVINIGTRQKDRERAENVIDVGYNKSEILFAIKKALFDNEFKEKIKKCANPYGDGKTAKKIAEILSKINIKKL